MIQVCPFGVRAEILRMDIAMTIWDGYGDWDAIAKNNSSEQIKNYITGDKKAWTPNFFSPALDYVFQYCKKEYKINLKWLIDSIRLIMLLKKFHTDNPIPHFLIWFRKKN